MMKVDLIESRNSVGMADEQNYSSYATTYAKDSGTLENLYPALVQSFVIIILGYIAGRTSMISQTQGKGLGNYVGRFALPALLFKNMYEINFQVVNWMMLSSILVSKSAVFLLVALFTFILIRPSHWGKIGLYGIFATQSNDFALGYPIVEVIYRNTHPHYIDYLSLLAPISLIFLNPIGFIFLEIHKWQKIPHDQRPSKLKAVITIIKGVVFNPVVFMSFCGICGNFIFKGTLPVVFKNILSVLANSFSATALFFLGLTMVGKIKGQTGKALLAPMLLICAKMLLLPYISLQAAKFLLKDSPANDTADMTSYAFLYGTFPTAPAVFLFANIYDVSPDKIATGMVVCTFLSAPIMFVSAQLVSMKFTEGKEYAALIRNTNFDVSILAIVTSVWVLGVLFVGRRIRTIPHQFTAFFVAAQMLCSVGSILWYSVRSYNVWLECLQTVFFLVGMFSARCWAAILAMTICLLKVRSLCFVYKIKFWFLLYGFGYPVLVTGILLITKGISKNHAAVRPLYMYGDIQLILTTCTLVINIIIIIAFIVILHRHDRTYMTSRSRTTSTTDMGTEEQSSVQSLRQPQASIQYNQSADNTNKTSTGRKPKRIVGRKRIRKQTKSSGVYQTCSDCTTCNDVPVGVANIEDIIPFPKPSQTRRNASSQNPGLCDETTPLLSNNSQTNRSLRAFGGSPLETPCIVSNACTVRDRSQCSTLTQKYDVLHLENMEEEDIAIARTRDMYQVTRHVILVLLLLLSALVALAVCLLRLFGETGSGVVVELEFLDVVLTYGQGVLAFGIFGLDTDFVIFPFVKRIRTCIWGSEIHLPRLDDLDIDDVNTCDQFVKHHKQQCLKAIVHCKKCGWRKYRDVFDGTELVNWLLDVGLANDRAEAVTYGTKLLLGRVIAHVQKQQHFHDLPYLYKFTDVNLSSSQSL